MIRNQYLLVKHGESDFRLYRRDGTETGHTWEESPDTRQIHALGVPQGCFCFRHVSELDAVDEGSTRE